MNDRPQLFLDRPPMLYIWRPFYRYVMVPLILPLLSSVRAYFTAPCEHHGHSLHTQLEELRDEMAKIQAKLDNLGAHTPAIIGKIESTYLDSLGQWSAMEHLITSSLRLSDRAAAKRGGTLERIESRHGALEQSLEECVAQQRAIKAQLSIQQLDEQNNWREMESLVMSLLAQPISRTVPVGKQDYESQI
jgi:hypothetical protein